MGAELLTTAEMAEADRLAITSGPHDGFGLMLNAGRVTARIIMMHHGAAPRVHILCGPGNNGGDGYVVAAELHRAAVKVCVHGLAAPRPESDAEKARMLWDGQVSRFNEFAPEPGDLVVDAVFGAGLARPVNGEVRSVIARTRTAGCEVVAVDLPSGVSGDSGAVMGDAFQAARTVTFFRKKPGHLLYPGRAHCGVLHVADIGIDDAVLVQLRPSCHENLPGLWEKALPRLSSGLHKYSRGAVGVFSGGISSTGAARLAAQAAQRSGAGAVTLYSPGDALPVNAAHLTSIMLARVDQPTELAPALDGKRRAYVLGPGFGPGDRLMQFALELLQHEHDGLVLDADGFTAFATLPDLLFRQAAASRSPLVLTPHAGEFARLFPSLAADVSLSKLDRARRAAALASAVVVFKGPDTVIAAPDGRAAINSNATAALATAGSGDVLAGIVAALLSRKVPPFEAACAAVWAHGEAGRRAGSHCVAEDLPPLLPGSLEAAAGAGSGEG